MARKIRLPSGMELDMEQGELRTPLGRGPIPMNTRSRSHSVTAPRWWRAYSDFVGDIGNWVSHVSSIVTTALTILVFIIGIIFFLIFCFGLGWPEGLILGAVLALFAYYIISIVAGIISLAANIVLGTIRYIFYNGWTLIASFVVLAAVIAIYN